VCVRESVCVYCREGERVCVHSVTENSSSHGMPMAQVRECVRERESVCVCVL